jgi:hypothetical protein
VLYARGGLRSTRRLARRVLERAVNRLGLFRNTGELSKDACSGQALAHLQALEAFLVACRATRRFKLSPPFRVEGEQAGVEARRIH